MTFSKWLSDKYAKENNQFSKLAKMLEEGADAPKRAKKKNVIKKYLVAQVVGPQTMRAFKEAYRKYEKDVARS